MAYYNKQRECMARGELDQLRLKLLKRVLRHTAKNSRYYKRKFRDTRFDPSTVKTLEHVRKIPTTDRSEVMTAQESRPPFGELPCLGLDSLATVVATTGTTGRPLLVPLTEFDSTQYCSPDSETWMRTFYSIGAKRGDLVQSAWNYNFWYFSGSCLSFSRGQCRPPFVVTGVGRTSYQLDVMKRLKPTIFFATQSYGLFMGQQYAKLPEKEARKIRVRAVVQGGEPGLLSIEGFRKKMKDAWCSHGREVDFFESAGASEIGYFGQECIAHEGLHMPEDYLFVEVLDPSGEQVAPGERGELVLTHLQREAMPLVRYKIGDVTTYDNEKCSCGRTHIRLLGIVGRTDDMVKVKGIKFFPTQVESLIRTIPGCTGECLITIDKDQGEALDSFEISVEHYKGADTEKISKEIVASIRALVGIVPGIRMVPEGELTRSPHKALRILDLRKFGAEERYKQKIDFSKRIG
jgi:phenylacetate-CoA ligase